MRIFPIFPFICICFGSCTGIHNPINKSARLIVVADTYIKERPVAQLVNLPVFTEATDSFVMAKDGDVQVYAVGELIYNLAQEPRKDFFKGDDIELFFGNGLKTDTLQSKLYINWGELNDVKGKIKKNDIDFFGWQYSDSLRMYNTPEITGKYFATIKIPWTDISDSLPHENSSIPFDVVLGNADDEFRQRAKVSWYDGKANAGQKQFGCIKLIKEDTASGKPETGIINAYKGTPLTDTIVDPKWHITRSYNISHLIYGIIKGKYDFSAFIRALWDNKYLYLLLDIQDCHRVGTKKNDMSKRQTFLDYGWIEKKDGTKIWEMNAVYSRHAGGAFKNQYTDTVLSLKKGKYFVKYTSDESHAPGNWDDDAPETSFYGILVYQKK